MRTFLIAFAAVVAAIFLGSELFPMGEVVTLHTVDEAGKDHHSALWIVDTLEGPVLRAGSPDAGWLDRLILHPGVSLERNGGTARYLATPVEDAGLRADVNEAMARKYGVAERLIRVVQDVDSSVVVKLSPVEAGQGASPDGH